MANRKLKCGDGCDDLNTLGQSSGRGVAESAERNLHYMNSQYQADGELARVLSAAGQARKVECGERLFSFGEPAQGVYLIVKGTARASLADQRRELMCRTAGPGSVLGLPSALCANRYQFDVQALEDVEAVFLETATVNEILRGQPELCMRAMSMVCEELEALRRTREHMQSCSKSSCALHEQCSQAVRPQ
jgi:CRP-like cAMP-binding protein